MIGEVPVDLVIALELARLAHAGRISSANAESRPLQPTQLWT
jgi:hypothetical protein